MRYVVAADHGLSEPRYLPGVSKNVGSVEMKNNLVIARIFAYMALFNMITRIGFDYKMWEFWAIWFLVATIDVCSAVTAVRR